MWDSLRLDLTRRSLLKAVAIIAAAATGYERSARGQSYFNDSAPDFSGARDPPQWGGGPGCNPNGNCPGNRPCFLRGTPILSEYGYLPIEKLSPGDRVVARFAGVTTIDRIASFTLYPFGRQREWLGPSRPVRVRRGALGDGVPAADLCLTASHAVYVDGYLVPAGDLVNGTSIVFDTGAHCETLDFFHIELRCHDILNADGAFCESLRAPGVEPCAPLLGFNGRRSELVSRLRSAAALLIDRRQPLDLIRDTLERRGDSCAFLEGSSDQSDHHRYVRRSQSAFSSETAAVATSGHELLRQDQAITSERPTGEHFK